MIFTIITTLLIISLILLIFVFFKNNKLNKEIINLEKENSHNKTISKQKEENNINLSRELSKLKIEITNLNEENNQNIQKIATLEEKNKSNENLEEKLKIQFENLSNDILEKNTLKLNQQNKEDLDSVLNPVKEQLKEFKSKVEEVYINESKDRSALQNELKNLKELNQQISSEANNLTKALTNNNKKQGSWGEVILESVIEKSGLRKNEEYFREQTFKNEDGKSFRPDVIIKLPDERDVIIDAKTSLKSYNNYVNSTEIIEQTENLKNYINSIKNHIQILSEKNYERLEQLNSLDFVFMFVPIESALTLVLEKEPSLYDEAFKQKVILVSPTTLLIALRAIENVWRFKRKSQNIEAINRRAEQLYNKFVGFHESMKKIDSSLQNARNSYDEAYNRLSNGRGNLINQAQKLKEESYINPKKSLNVL